MAKILLVEDEINIASFIERGLKEFVDGNLRNF